MPPYTDSQSHCYDGPSSPSSTRSHHRGLHPPSSRPLQHKQDHDEPKKATSSNNKTETTSRDGLLQHAAMELEAMRCRPPPQKKRGDSNNSISTNGSISNNISNNNEVERSFPPACLHLLHSLPGNRRCHDCHNGSASWASVSYGIILCLQCSGKHRGLGVNCSFIKSLTLDSWKRKEILCMLEGGNEQLTLFFDRHQMGGTTDGGAGGNVTSSSNVGVVGRYRTKAASFYRQHLMIHAKQLAEGGIYEGREASRRSSSSKQQRKSTNKSSSGKCRKKSREQQLKQQLPTVTEKESVEPPCGAVGA